MILAGKGQIEEYRKKGCWGDRTLIDDFEQNADQMPDRTAVADPLNKESLMGVMPKKITYRELKYSANGSAASLKASGIEKDDVVLVQLPNCWELAMLYIAVAKAGAVISPVPMQWRMKELDYAANLTKAAAIITMKQFHGHDHLQTATSVKERNPFIRQVISYEDLIYMATQSPDHGLEEVLPGGDDIFTLCWTSGTEAQSKGCPLSHNNWRCQSLLAASGGLKPGDNFLTAGPLVNMGAIGTVLAPWMIQGGTLVLHHPFDPVLLLKQLVEEKINYTLLVPAVLNLILKHPQVDEFDLSSIRSITVGSAPPSLWSMEEFKRRWHVDIGNIWGQNEGTGLVSTPTDVPDIHRRVDQFPRYGVKGHRWSVPVTEFICAKIVDESGAELTEDNAVGELVYKGPNVMAGYFNRPDLNEAAFDGDGFFRTGDLFQIKGDIHLKYFDRVKDIIIRGGLNISAQEVENMVLAHPDVQDAAAVGMPDDNLGERTCVYVVPRQDAPVTLESIVEFMKKSGCAVYKLPERIEVVTEIPRNPVGKILKKGLRRDIMSKMSG